MDALPVFLRQVRNRSKEHERAMQVLAREGFAGQMVAVLRQELDSMVRVVLPTDAKHRTTGRINRGFSSRGEVVPGNLTSLCNRQRNGRPRPKPSRLDTLGLQVWLCLHSSFRPPRLQRPRPIGTAPTTGA